MKNSKSKTGIIIIAVIIVSFAVLKFNEITAPPTIDTPASIPADNTSQENIEQLITDYISNHLNDITNTTTDQVLTLEKLSFLDNNRAIITYSHNSDQYIGRVNYILEPDQKLMVDNFQLLSKNGQLKISTQTETADDLSIIALKKALAEKLNWDFDQTTLEAIKNIDSFWQGKIKTNNTKSIQPFWAIANNSHYTIFFNSNQTAPCRELIDNNFPEALILECY